MDDGTADAAVDQEISIEAFMLTVLAAYSRADPELIARLAERLADWALLEQFEELRRDGRLPVA
jgi:hypothetical protein